MKNEPDLPPTELVLLLEANHVGPYAIQHALDLARRLGVDLHAHLLQDRNVKRAARLSLTKRIGLESGRQGSFSRQDIDDQLRRTAEELKHLLQREAKNQGVSCHFDPSGEERPVSGRTWILFGNPASLQKSSLPSSHEEMVLLLHPPRPSAPQPVTALVSLTPPSCELLERAAQVAARCAWEDPLLVFTNQPVRCERELGSTGHFHGFQPLPRGPITASRLLRWVERHGATSAIVLLPTEPSEQIENWALQMAQLSEIPLMFLREIP